MTFLQALPTEGKIQVKRQGELLSRDEIHLSKRQKCRGRGLEDFFAGGSDHPFPAQWEAQGEQLQKKSARGAGREEWFLGGVGLGDPELNVRGRCHRSVWEALSLCWLGEGQEDLGIVKMAELL